MPANTIFFMHIPKTAGSSVHRILELNFAPWETYSLAYPALKSQELFVRLPQKKRNSFRLVKGHFPYGFHQHVDTDPIYVSFVREPISRVLSDYNYRCTTPFLPSYREFRDAGFSLDYYLDNLYIPSLSTLFFAGVGHLRKADVPMDFLLRQAVDNLDRFSFVGLADEFEKSVGELATTVSLRRIAPVRTNVNSRKRKLAFAPEEMSRIAAAEKWDLELYDTILQRRKTISTSFNRRNVKCISAKTAVLLHYCERILFRIYSCFFNVRYRSQVSGTCLD
jgi:hypothetical protein